MTHFTVTPDPGNRMPKQQGVLRRAFLCQHQSSERPQGRDGPGLLTFQPTRFDDSTFDRVLGEFAV